MEHRKIIEFGKSSFVISLPKAWLRERKIAKGDVVYLYRDEEKLVVYPLADQGNKKEKKKTK